MGNVCTRQLGPAGPVDHVLRLRQEQQYGLFERTLAETFQNALRNLWWAGLVRWFFVPANLALGAVYSECSSGLPLQLYAIPCVATLFGWLQERCATRTLTSFPERVAASMDAADNAVEDEEIKHFLEAYLKAVAAASSACSLRACGLMQQWLLQASGLLSALGLVASALMPGQVKQCELLYPDASWLRMPDAIPALRRVHLSNMYLAVIVIVLLIQGGEGVCEANKARRLANAFSDDSPSPDEKEQADCLDCSLPGWSSWHGLERKVITLSVSGAVTAEWAAAVYAKAIFMELSGEFLRIARSQDDAGEAQDNRRFVFQMAHVVRLIMLQWVPGMLLMRSFFSHVFSTLDQYGVAQVVVAFALSARGALMQAVAALALAQPGGPRCRTAVPLVVGLAALAVTACAVAEFVMSYGCPWHTFDWSRWSCAATGT